MKMNSMLSKIAVTASAVLLSTTMVAPAQAAPTNLTTNGTVVQAVANDLSKSRIDCDKNLSCTAQLETPRGSQISFPFKAEIQSGQAVIKNKVLVYTENPAEGEEIRIIGYTFVEQHSGIDFSATVRHGRDLQKITWQIRYQDGAYVLI
ncbi:hypothetical protein D2E26_0271 [Bifidobacterium dolichotidis]|uniref:Uncharacterized protein n=1 Tax=Bifidobacterium dolichotidis TaxID=2306976 RepID=A0A430FS71_9BIFI|nr:hypothetical protein [Bifidobacterium dolichotidis]RSX55708.1 hypothetical protein D2E26_0271 [Bifidobacterium dolichotidis]